MAKNTISNTSPTFEIDIGAPIRERLYDCAIKPMTCFLEKGSHILYMHAIESGDPYYVYTEFTMLTNTVIQEKWEHNNIFSFHAWDNPGLYFEEELW